MTDDERAQLLSDVLDGVATAEDHALVNADAELQADLAVMQRVQEAMQSPLGPVPDATREAMIAAALDELTVGPAPAAPAPAIDLAAQRSRRQRRLNLLGAAAAVVLVVGGAAIALRAGTGDDSDAASFAEAGTDGAASNEDLTTARADTLSTAGNELEESAVQDDSAQGSVDQDSATQGSATQDSATQDSAPEAAAAQDSADQDSADQDSADQDSADLPAEAAPRAPIEPPADDESAQPSPRVPLLPLELESCRAELEAHVPGLAEIDSTVTSPGIAVVVIVTAQGELIELRIEIETCEIAEQSPPESNGAPAGQ